MTRQKEITADRPENTKSEDHTSASMNPVSKACQNIYKKPYPISDAKSSF